MDGPMFRDGMKRDKIRTNRNSFLKRAIFTATIVTGSLQTAVWISKSKSGQWHMSILLWLNPLSNAGLQGSSPQRKISNLNPLFFECTMNTSCICVLDSTSDIEWGAELWADSGSFCTGCWMHTGRDGSMGFFGGAESGVRNWDLGPEFWEEGPVKLDAFWIYADWRHAVVVIWDW